MPSAFDRFRQALTKSQPSTSYAVTKSDDEEQYTLGVLYVPGARDSDDEFTTAEELQHATWDYIRKGQRRIRDTHTDKEIGELVEIISWPFPVEVESRLGDGKVHKMKLPEGTVFAGVVWDDVVWPLVRKGKVRGYSLGGRAVRMKEAGSDSDLPLMRDLIVPDA